jgi:hypothetical protein
VKTSVTTVPPLLPARWLLRMRIEPPFFPTSSWLSTIPARFLRCPSSVSCRAGPALPNRKALDRSGHPLLDEVADLPGHIPRGAHVRTMALCVHDHELAVFYALVDIFSHAQAGYRIILALKDERPGMNKRKVGAVIGKKSHSGEIVRKIGAHPAKAFLKLFR